MRDVFSAVADPTRREILSMLATKPDMPLYEITDRFPAGRTAISKHLTVLKEAGLVRDRKVGRETRFSFDPTPLKEVRDWVAHYEQFWTERLDDLKSLLEEDHQ